MKVDTGGYPSDVVEVGRSAAGAESDGYDASWVPETTSDPFLGVAIAAERTRRIELGTAIAVAFARNPMTVAVAANDLQLATGGRFMLGLGSQIEPHITKRYSMPWSRPAARMREFVAAIRAIWHSWASGEKPGFRGDFYTHTLMTPFFDPGPNPHGNPPIYLAGVGPRMTRVAGEVADGFLCHGFTTERYLREVTVPALQQGREAAGKSWQGFEISGPSFVVADDEGPRRDDAAARVRRQISFYGSTPAYRPVLDLHGWGDLQDELNALSKRGEWDRMADVVDDEVLHTFAVIGTPEDAAAELLRRYGGVATRIGLSVPIEEDPDRWRKVLDTVRAG
ncbi:MAG: TIGR03617 family F420-dependent LLM class oxidoreductase [Pseudonocardiaceae bacterium]|nr:TIGR03617 family F420-dependent LLM class oxidoreductase [Pseudonocardiaceae bacterium]